MSSHRHLISAIFRLCVLGFAHSCEALFTTNINFAQYKSVIHLLLIVICFYLRHIALPCFPFISLPAYSFPFSLYIYLCLAAIESVNKNKTTCFDHHGNYLEIIKKTASTKRQNNILSAGGGNFIIFVIILLAFSSTSRAMASKMFVLEQPILFLFLVCLLPYYITFS